MHLRNGDIERFEIRCIRAVTFLSDSSVIDPDYGIGAPNPFVHGNASAGKAQIRIPGLHSGVNYSVEIRTIVVVDSTGDELASDWSAVESGETADAGKSDVVNLMQLSLSLRSVALNPSPCHCMRSAASK